MNLFEFVTPLTLAKFQLSWPDERYKLVLYGAGFFIAIALAIFVYIRDARRLSPIALIWMLLLRVSVFAVLIVIALNPHDRTVQTDFSPSQVVILIDRSTSMALKESTRAGNGATGSATANRKRYEAVSALVADSSMLKKLRENHEVSIYTFNSQLEGDFKLLPVTSGPSATKKASPDGEASEKEPETDWLTFLNPNRQQENTPVAPKPDAKSDENDSKTNVVGQGSPNETRLGEVLRELLREKKGKTLSAVIVVSDGQSNIGLDPVVANAFATQNKIRLVTVGVGGLERPTNVRLLSIRSPTDVNKDNPYDITAVIQGTGMKGKDVNVRLFVKPENAPDADLKEVLNATKSSIVKLGSVDDPPSEVTFNINPEKTGGFEYVVRVNPVIAIEEFSTEDNELPPRRITVVERNLGVLIVAGGPMREYRFARNMLYRHKNINVDVWLQSADGTKIEQISQDCDDLLIEFPKNFPTRPMVDAGDAEPDPKRAVQYDVVIAFDPDWSAEGFQVDSITKLTDWVSKNAGGFIPVAGDVNTPELAAAKMDPMLKPILNMYPVTLNEFAAFDGGQNQRPQAWKIKPTDEGRSAKFLQLGETEEESDEVWEEFEGIYSCYPTTGRKSGATVYSYFTEPGVEVGDFGAPILFASQFYGVGRVLYIGSAEMWRLRSIDEDYFDRFWVKIVWEAGLGRMNRKSAYGTVMLERDEYYLGQSVRVIAYLEDTNNQPVNVPNVQMELIDPTGEFVQPIPRLLADKTQPGYYTGYFTARIKGTYRIKVENPAVEQEPGIPASIIVKLSDRETADPRQNTKLLTDLARDTGGKYMPLADLAQMFASVADKKKAMEKAIKDNAPESTIADSKSELAEAEAMLTQLFPNRSDQFEVDERITELWDTRAMMFLLVALLSVEWLTRKLLKLA